MSEKTLHRHNHGSRNRDKIPALAAGAVLVATVFAGMVGKGPSEDEPSKSPKIEQSTPTTTVIVKEGQNLTELFEAEVLISNQDINDYNMQDAIDGVVELNGGKAKILPGQVAILPDLPNLPPSGDTTGNTAP